jgi:transcriptional regulator with XRE-family HTH domain
MRLRVLRAERGLSLRQVEAATGVAKETLSEVERGVRHPYDTTLAKLAKCYDVPLEDLLEEPTDPKAEAPTSPQPGEDTERRVTELERWIEHIDRRSQAWEQQVAVKENPFLVDPKTAVAWDAAVAKEVAEITEAAEKAARSFIEESTEGMLVAQELQKLEDAYNRLWEVSRKVTAQVNEVVVGEGKARLARAAEERESEFQAMEEWLSSAEAEAVRRS